jgi:signal transduction histidine kinase/DNA-binding response OmpR family regulator
MADGNDGRIGSVGAGFLSGGGNLGALMRAKDWAKTALGPPQQWPQSLRTAVSIMLDSQFAMVIAWGPQFHFLYNDRYRPVLGSTKHPDALGRPAHEIFPEVWDYIGPLFNKALSGEAVALNDQMIPLDRNGYLEECFFTLSYSPIRDEQGVGGMLAVVAETTERVQNERQLALLGELASRTADARTLEDACRLGAECLQTDAADFPFGILYLLDPDADTATLAATSRIPDSDPAVSPQAWPIVAPLRSEAPTLVTLDPAQFEALETIPGRPPGQAVVVPLAASGHEGVSGVLVLGLHPLRRFDDNYRRFVELVGSQIAASLGNAHAYQEERRRAEALAELDRAKTAFFSNVSHEFRTPLTLMLAPMDEMLQDPGSVATRAPELLPVMRRSAQRLQRLVNSLLDFSRIEAGRAQASFEPVDLAEYTSELASVFRAAVEKAGMKLVIDCPPLSQPVYVDRDMWEKIVLNLLSNAFKYTFEGEIRVILRPGDSGVTLEVADTGIGIPEQELPRIFERFYRVEGARGRTHEGTGIGLALAQELLKLHGSTLNVASKPGMGSRFSVTLPYGTAHLPADRLGAQRALSSTALRADAFVDEALQWLPNAAGTPRESAFLSETATIVIPPAAAMDERATVLIADDNADMREYLRRLVAGAGFDVVTVGDGEEALARIQSQAPDLVLSDVMMPKLDGIGLIKALRSDETTRHLPVILLSARAGEEARIEGLAYGADDYLVKPFSAREVTARIGTALALARARRVVETALREEARLLEKLNRVAAMVAAELDLTRVVQAVTDAATELSGAAFGSFFYNVKDDKGEAYWLYSLSGAPREAFSNFPMPRNTQVFEPTFSGTGIVRSADITADPRYGRNAPYHGMPKGHLPVRSYLAVPVRSRSGGVLGGLFFGHPEPGMFTERAERLVAGIAQHAAIAIDNAQLYEQAKAMESRQAALFESERVARAGAEQAARIKDEFLATISHELRTPLNAIVGWVNVLQSSHSRPADVQRAVEVIKRNAQAQAQLIEDLLDMSRIVTGKVRLDVQPVLLSSVIESAITSVLPAAAVKEIRVQRVLDPLAGPIKGDPGRLQQVMWNLLTNAIKFTPKGGRVQVTLERVNSHLEISVSDTGIGIEPEFLPLVFDRFRQADSSASRQHSGLGLGLAISKELVELHGGSIRARSPGKGGGAVFVISLPLVPLHAERADESRQHPRSTRRDLPDDIPPASLEGVKVLAVEDEPDALELIGRVLADAGGMVKACASATEALAALGRERFDVIVSDLGMAGMDGYAFIRAARQLSDTQGGATPAIALTAFARSEDRQRAYRAGFQMHVAKPVDPSELVTIVAALTRGRSSQS